MSETGSVAVSTESDGECTVITVAGEVDAHTAPAMRDAVDAAVGPDARVVLDLSDVTFLDSTGLGVIVTAVKHLREVEGTLDLVITSPRVLKVFTLTGLDVVIPIHEDLAAAKAL